MVELAQIWGNDLSLQDNGDILLSTDTPGSPEATTERVYRIVLTNPTVTDPSGNPIGRPDDLFHPTFGAGIRAAIGEPFTPALQQAVSARVLAACLLDPYIASSPPPSVPVFQQIQPGLVQMIAVVYAISGQVVRTPTLAITPTALQIGANV